MAKLISYPKFYGTVGGISHVKRNFDGAVIGFIHRNRLPNGRRAHLSSAHEVLKGGRFVRCVRLAKSLRFAWQSFTGPLQFGALNGPVAGALHAVAKASGEPLGREPLLWSVYGGVAAPLEVNRMRGLGDVLGVPLVVDFSGGGGGSGSGSGSGVGGSLSSGGPGLWLEGIWSGGGLRGGRLWVDGFDAGSFLSAPAGASHFKLGVGVVSVSDRRYVVGSDSWVVVVPGADLLFGMDWSGMFGVGDLVSGFSLDALFPTGSGQVGVGAFGGVLPAGVGILGMVGVRFFRSELIGGRVLFRDLGRGDGGAGVVML